MKKTFLILLLLLPIDGYALWKAPERPQAKELRFCPINSNRFFVIADIPENFDCDGARRIAYETKDGGFSFEEIAVSNLPLNSTTNNLFSKIRYSIIWEGDEENPLCASQCIIRTLDNGDTWEHTNYESYISRLTHDSFYYKVDVLISEGKLPYKHYYCRLILKILCVLYMITMLIFIRRTGWMRMGINLAKSGLLIMLFYLALVEIFSLYNYLIQAPYEDYGIVHAMIYVSTHPLYLIIGFMILAATLPATIDAVRYKTKWNPRDNLGYVIWESISVALWLLIGYAVLWAITMADKPGLF